MAIKKVELKKAEQEKENLRFAMELKFKFIVGFHGFFVEGGYLYIIMDFCQVSNNFSIQNSYFIRDRL